MVQIVTLNTAIHLRKNKQYEDSRNILFKLSESSSNLGTIFLNIAWSYDNQGLEDQALKYYIQALQEDMTETEKFEALFGLACTYRCLKQYHKSKTIFVKILKDYPLAIEVIPFYALCLISLDQKDTALKLLFNLIIEYPSTQNIRQYQDVIRSYVDDL